MEDARFALEMFPKEIWEMIILEVKDSEDLRSLMKASKQLNDSFIKIRHFWLLHQVLPFLIPTTNELNRYLEMGDLKNLRLVDKRWRRAVNAYLENQPKLRPYNRNDNKLNSKEHMSFECCSPSEQQQELEMGAVTLSNFSEISNFCRIFKNCESNPFLSRCIVGCRKPTIEVNAVEEERLEFWEEMDKKIFQKCGKHIWFLKIKWEGNHRFYSRECDRNTAWKWIVKSLSSLPNLKSLCLDANFANLEGEMKYSKVKGFLEENCLPNLESLESLKIQYTLGLHELLCRQLVSKYCLQLKRLRISISVFVGWEEEEWKYFPNLTELSLDDAIGTERVTLILKVLEAPQLSKLRLAGFGCLLIKRPALIIRMEEDVFKWITLFPSLLHLDISCAGITVTESGALSSPNDSKLSLKYFKINHSQGLNYNFLSCLPNLESLQVCFDQESFACPETQEIKVDKSLCKINVWELCPKLRILSLIDHVTEQGHKFKEFHRSNYEKLEKNTSRDCTHLRFNICNIYFIRESPNEFESNYATNLFV